MGAHRDGTGVAALAEDRGPLLAGSRRELPQEFRPLRLDARNSDEPSQHGQCGCEAWADCDWAAGKTSLGADWAFNHIYSTNLGEKLAVPEGHYTHAKARHTGNVWLRHAKEWRHFDAAASAGVSLTPYGTSALWSLSAGWTPVEELRVGAGVWQSMRLPTFTDLYYTSPAQINNLDLVPEHAVTYRISADYLKHCWNISAQVYYRAGRDIIDWVWREDMGDKWHSEQSSRLDTFGAELAGGYASAEGFLRRGDALLRLHHDRPQRGCHRQALWTSCATRRHWPSRCVSCGGCRWR